MVIKLKAKTFRNSQFTHGWYCPIAKTLQKMGFSDPAVYIHRVDIEGEEYLIQGSYNHVMYGWDKIKSFLLGYSNVTVRRINIVGLLYPPGHENSNPMSVTTSADIIEGRFPPGIEEGTHVEDYHPHENF